METWSGHNLVECILTWWCFPLSLVCYFNYNVRHSSVKQLSPLILMAFRLTKWYFFWHTKCIIEATGNVLLVWVVLVWDLELGPRLGFFSIKLKKKTLSQTIHYLSINQLGRLLFSVCWRNNYLLSSRQSSLSEISNSVKKLFVW